MFKKSVLVIGIFLALEYIVINIIACDIDRNRLSTFAININ